MSVFLHGVCSPLFLPSTNKKLCPEFAEVPSSPIFRWIVLFFKNPIVQISVANFTFLLFCWLCLQICYLNTLQQFTNGSLQDCILLVSAHSIKIAVECWTKKTSYALYYIFSLALNLFCFSFSLNYIITQALPLSSNSKLYTCVMICDIALIAFSAIFNIFIAEKQGSLILQKTLNMQPSCNKLSPLGDLTNSFYLKHMVLKIVSLFIGCCYAYHLPHTASIFYAHAISLTWFSILHTLLFLPVRWMKDSITQNPLLFMQPPLETLPSEEKK